MPKKFIVIIFSLGINTKLLKSVQKITHTMIFTANPQIYLQVTFLELHFLDPTVCLFFTISGTLYQIALLESCTNMWVFL